MPYWQVPGEEPLDAEVGRTLNEPERAHGCDLRLPNVRAKLRAEADDDWPRKDNVHCGLERPGVGCRSASAWARG